MHGILSVHKPSGPTSHDIINLVRRISGVRRVGHAGTLDPLASGVLLVFIGKATRLIEYMPAEPKIYIASLLLGRSTDTADITGETVQTQSAQHISLPDLQGAAKDFRGVIEQIPPMYSAIKRDGQPLYKLAREGKQVQRPKRRVNIYSLEVLGFEPGEFARATISVSCSSGTYIRTLCEDIGAQLGLPACMSELVRNRVGDFSLEQAFTPAQLEELSAAGKFVDALLPVSAALEQMPQFVCDHRRSEMLTKGNTVEYDGSLAPGRLLSLIKEDGQLLGVGVVLAERGRTIVKPEKILA